MLPRYFHLDSLPIHPPSHWECNTLQLQEYQHPVDDSDSNDEKALGIETPVSAYAAILYPTANLARSRLKSQTSSLPTITSLPTPATEDVIIIAFMGITGSGKSSFIKALTGCDDIVVGDGLKSSKPKDTSEMARVHAEITANGPRQT